MNEDVVADLKQFIAATVAQQISGVRQELLQTLGQKMDEGFAAIADAFEANSDAVEKRLNEYDQRLTRLERKAV